MIVSAGVGARIRHALMVYNQSRGEQAIAAGGKVERYTDRQFAIDVGMAERGKPYSFTTVADWIAERNEPDIGVGLAMEVVLGRPGIAVWIFFNVWPRSETGQVIPTPGAVRSTVPAKKPFVDPRDKPKARRKAAAGGVRKHPKR